jgi:hypothetical protein
MPALMAPHDDSITSETVTRGRSHASFLKNKKATKGTVMPYLNFLAAKKTHN